MTLNSVWFVLLAFMLAAYAVLDGFDLGVGAIHLLLGRTREERAQLVASIGPVWNGNEVWLLGAGGSLVAAFPTLYAASFSGFYLALMLVLWLLLLRGIGIEFRHQIHHPLWEDAWDVVFSIASALLALLFGVALGNVLRGVPFGADGQFRGTFALLLNGFALLGGALSVATLSMHGACWVALKTDGALQRRARRFASTWWWASLALALCMVAASSFVRPEFTRNFAAHPWLIAAPLLATVACAAAHRFIGRDDQLAFLSSSAYIAGILASVAAGLYPMLLPASDGSAHPGLDIYNAAAPPHSLLTALFVYLIGLTIVAIYLVNIYRVWRGKATGVYH
jgi:cytochrome bd ubiquinol oxidase subunit II